MFAVRKCALGEHAVCFYDPVFKHIGIVGLLPPQLENRVREKEHARERVRGNQSVTEAEEYFNSASG